MNESNAAGGLPQGAVARRAEWAAHERLWLGALEGRELGCGITVLFYATEEIGQGPKWHVHTYDELFIVRTGRALFTIGDQKVEASAGTSTTISAPGSSRRSTFTTPIPGCKRISKTPSSRKGNRPAANSYSGT